MSHYLVTGAAGFIGSCIAAKLLREGHTVTTIDNLSTGKAEVVPAGCRFIKGNVYDADVIAELRDEHFDAIVHIAGQSSGEISFEDPVYDLQTNTQSTLLLLDYARKHDCKHFVYASSMSVYGDHEDNPLVSETTPTVPKSFYAVGKLASENYMRIFSKYGIHCTALRFFNVYGVGQNLDNYKQGMASIFLAMAIRDRSVLVKGAKDRFRDFVYVDDVVHAVELAMNDESASFDIFNVCTGVPTTVEHVIDEIAANLPFKFPVQYTTGTPGDQHGIYGDNRKIREKLGWVPQYDFATGMKKMIAWAVQK